MRILAVAAFDPAGVLSGHRTILRAAGVDYRVALERVWESRPLDPDFLGSKAAEAIRDFAASADVIQIHPGIGDGSGTWADGVGTFSPELGMDPPERKICGVNLAQEGRQAMRVAYFHGSAVTWANRKQYSARYRAMGYTLAASTLDYAVELPAAYLPPAIPDYSQANLRAPDEPLRLIHAPTNPRLCHTAECERAARAAGIGPHLVYTVDHATTLAAKRKAHAGFDHMRGSFSVNTLENAAIGLVPLVGLSVPCEERLNDEGIDSYGLVKVNTEATLTETLRILAANADLTRSLQLSARAWYEGHFMADKITARLMRFYEHPAVNE